MELCSSYAIRHAIAFQMEALAFFVFCLYVDNVISIRYDNVTVEPALRQLYDFRLENPKPIGLMTTSSGEPVEIRDTFQLNSDQFANQYNLDSYTRFHGERIPERVVHAKGTGAFGYLQITNDVTKYTSADLFNKIGKKTPLVGRFSTADSNLGGTDLGKELKGFALKFYTEEGNLDLLCLNTPVYFYKDPVNFPHLARVFKRNPRTGLRDFTDNWDLLTLKPELLFIFFWIISDYGSPDGYRRMDAFPIHTYELSNKDGEKYYARFNFRTEQGLANLTLAQGAAIQAVDLDYFNRDLYNAIERKEYPSWKMEMDILRSDDVKVLSYDPFDVTALWKNGTYITVPIGRVVFNRNPDNFFRVVEQSAFNPGNLVPGIPGPVDSVFKIRRFSYLDTQNYRLGRNHNNILVNLPKYSMAYNRDGRPPVRENMKDIPNYYPNSFNGPMPYVDSTRPDKVLRVLERNVVDLQQLSDFYNVIMRTDAERQRFVDAMVETLVTAIPSMQERAMKMMYLIDPDLGKRLEISLKAAVLAAAANQSA